MPLQFGSHRGRRARTFQRATTATLRAFTESLIKTSHAGHYADRLSVVSWGEIRISMRLYVANRAASDD